MTSAAASSDPERPLRAWEEEAAVVRRVAEGERAASRQLVDQYLKPVTRYAFRMLGDAAEAEDVAQETFVKLWREAARWQPRAKLSTWLYRVAHNACVDRLRARKTREATPLPELSAEGQQPGELLERREASEAVAHALSELPERQRAAIALVYYQGLRNYEAAEVLGVKVEAVESLLARARRQLKRVLRPPSAASPSEQGGT